MATIEIHKLEILRKRLKMTLQDIGDVMNASYGQAWLAERRKPIGRKYIDRLIAWSERVQPDDPLTRDDFVEARQGKANTNGAQREKGR